MCSGTGRAGEQRMGAGWIGRRGRRWKQRLVPFGEWHGLAVQDWSGKSGLGWPRCGVKRFSSAGVASWDKARCGRVRHVAAGYGSAG